MIAFPELGITVDLPEEYNDAGFNPVFATKILDKISDLRARVSPQSYWNKVPALVQRPVFDHVEIVLSVGSDENIKNLKRAEYGTVSTPPEAIVRRSVDYCSASIDEYYKSFGEENETF